MPHCSGGRAAYQQLRKPPQPETGGTARSFFFHCLAWLATITMVGGCDGSWSAWAELYQDAPWCAPNTHSRIFRRTGSSMGVPTGQVAFTDRSGHKKNTAAFQDELNTYFVDCKFTKGWPEFGVAGNYRPLIAPFRFHFVSMDPVVIVGVAKEDPTDTNPDYLYTGQHTFIGTNYINDAFQAGTTFPYRPGAKVVWFSPAVDHDLHDIDLASRTARIALAGSEFLTISVDGSQLVTSRQ